MSNKKYMDGTGQQLPVSFYNVLMLSSNNNYAIFCFDSSNYSQWLSPGFASINDAAHLLAEQSRSHDCSLHLIFRRQESISHQQDISYIKVCRPCHRGTWIKCCCGLSTLHL